MEFVNKIDNKYYACKLVKPRHNARGGFVAVPSWLLGKQVFVKDHDGNFYDRDLVVLNNNRSVLLFNPSKIGLRVFVEYTS